MGCRISQTLTGLPAVLLDLGLQGIGLQKGKMRMIKGQGVGAGAGHLSPAGDSRGQIMMQPTGSVKGRMIVVGGLITLDVTSQGGIDDVIILELYRVVAINVAFSNLNYPPTFQ